MEHIAAKARARDIVKFLCHQLFLRCCSMSRGVQQLAFSADVHCVESPEITQLPRSASAARNKFAAFPNVFFFFNLNARRPRPALLANAGKLFFFRTQPHLVLQLCSVRSYRPSPTTRNRWAADNREVSSDLNWPSFFFVSSNIREQCACCKRLGLLFVLRLSYRKRHFETTWPSPQFLVPFVYRRNSVVWIVLLYFVINQSNLKMLLRHRKPFLAHVQTFRFR